jgi:hypothetical protein
MPKILEKNIHISGIVKYNRDALLKELSNFFSNVVLRNQS